MIYEVSASRFVLSSGLTLPANRGILGLSPDPYFSGSLFEGFDGVVADVSDLESFSAADRQEIALFMIAMWGEWASRAMTPRPPVTNARDGQEEG